jgi:hypothetical protein
VGGASHRRRGRGRNSARVGPRSRSASLGKTRDVGAVLLRGLAGAPVRRDGVSAAAQRSGAAGRGEGGGARVRGGGRGWEEEERLGLLFVGRRVALACGSGAGVRRGSRPEITAGRYARAEGAGGGRRSWRVGQGCQGQRARARAESGSGPVRAWRVLRDLGRGAAGPCGG